MSIIKSNSKLEITDLLLCITKFLSPIDNNNLFKVNKCINKSENRCKLTYYFDKQIRLSELIKLDKYKNKYTNILYDFHNSYDFDFSLLHNIKYLTFGDDFNRPINNLHDSIKHLTFEFYYDKPITNLPNSIAHLTFGENFNQPITNLPNSIRNLTLSKYYNNILNIPSNVIIKKY